MSKQTALQWFLDKLPHSIETQFSKQIQQAMQMEKEQMKDVYLTHCVKAERLRKIFEQQFEQYYNETYGGNNE